jgi:hypothetical protein
MLTYMAIWLDHHRVPRNALGGIAEVTLDLVLMVKQLWGSCHCARGAIASSGTFQTNVPQNEVSKVEFFEGKLKMAFVRVVKVIAVNQVAFDSFIIRTEVFNMFQV